MSKNCSTVRGEAFVPRSSPGRAWVAAALFLALGLTSSYLPGQERDRSGEKTPKNASLSGTVTAADTGFPLPLAEVRVASDQPGGPPRVVLTDAQGRFAVNELLAGRYLVTVSKPPFVKMDYGEKGSGEGGKVIELGPGDSRDRIDVRLQRGGVITGTVVDEFGQPVVRAQVRALRAVVFGDEERLITADAGERTNDLGEFRLFGLQPADYVISAVASYSRDVGNAGYFETFYPSSSSASAAVRVVVEGGRALSGIAITLIPTKMIRISGVAMDTGGNPLRGTLSLIPVVDGIVPPPLGVISAAFDGTFSFSGVPPGNYLLRALVRPSSKELTVASLRLSVGEQDISGLQLVPGPSGTVGGRVISGARALPSGVQISAFSTDPSSGSLGLPPAQADKDGQFIMKVPSGSYWLRVAGLPPGWALKGIYSEGRDVTDAGIEVSPSAKIDGLTVEVTDRLSVLSGSVTDAKRKRTADYIVAAFSVVRERWNVQQRYKRTARSDQYGNFEIRGLPAGEYNVIALEGSARTLGLPSALLEALQAQSTRVRVTDGETTRVELERKVRASGRE